jgi:hypothetical protein
MQPLNKVQVVLEPVALVDLVLKMAYSQAITLKHVLMINQRGLIN